MEQSNATEILVELPESNRVAKIQPPDSFEDFQSRISLPLRSDEKSNLASYTFSYVDSNNQECEIFDDDSY